MDDDRRVFILTQRKARTAPYTFYRIVDGVEDNSCVIGERYTEDVRLARKYYGMDEVDRHISKGDKIVEVASFSSKVSVRDVRWKGGDDNKR